MELLCPQCMGALETEDGRLARCTTHGGEFQILFSLWQQAAPPVIQQTEAITFQLSPGAMCFQHQSVPAAFVCQECGAPVCAVCVFDQDDGRRLCPQCVARSVRAGDWAPSPAVPEIPAGVHCVQHPNIAATQKCNNCGAFMCATCDFALPGNLHVCPACVAAPKTALSSRRKGLLIGSYVLAVVATVGIALLLGGAFAELARSKGGQQMVGTLITAIVLVPGVIGMTLGFSAIDRRLANPLSVWIGTIWNVVIVGTFLLLSIIGLLTK